MDYKKSVFNFEYKRNSDENVIYNTFSKALVVLSDTEYKKYFNLLPMDETYTKDLIENGIFVDAKEDEMAFMKYFHYKTKFSNDAMFLTIAPTMECNFACPYCYENRRTGHMSKEIQDAIVDFLEDSINNGVKAVNITWYGGEPMLYFDTVEYLSGKFVEICNRKEVHLKMDMVTNGYLLTPETVEKLDDIGIGKIQITLDGIKEHHDVRRPLKGGQGTFDKIYNNLRLFDDSPLPVLIRMNVDNENCVDFIKLKKLIADLENENIEVYASPVEDINKDTINEISDFMTTEEFESFAMKSCDDGVFGDEDFSVMDDRYCFCTSETQNCYVIDEKGNFYKCWDEVGREEYACFNILEPDQINYTQIAKFVANDPFSDSKCGKCVFLPLCFGGCKFQRAHLDKSVCGFTNESLKKYIETTFFRN